MKDNYCLEQCKKCNQIADRYVEYDNNLKILSVLLCFTQIHRHIFFNVEVINSLKTKCIGVTLFLLFMLYLHESKVNYRKYLEKQFINDVRELKMRELRAAYHENQQATLQNESLNLNSMIKDDKELSQDDTTSDQGKD